MLQAAGLQGAAMLLVGSNLLHTLPKAWVLHAAQARPGRRIQHHLCNLQGAADCSRFEHFEPHLQPNQLQELQIQRGNAAPVAQLQLQTMLAGVAKCMAGSLVDAVGGWCIGWNWGGGWPFIVLLIMNNIL